MVSEGRSCFCAHFKNVAGGSTAPTGVIGASGGVWVQSDGERWYFFLPASFLPGPPPVFELGRRSAGCSAAAATDTDAWFRYLMRPSVVEWTSFDFFIREGRRARRGKSADSTKTVGELSQRLRLQLGQDFFARGPATTGMD